MPVTASANPSSYQSTGQSSLFTRYDALVACHQRGFSPSVLLPKTHSVDDIRSCQNDLFIRLNKAVQVLPIIKSQQGVDSLENILDTMPIENRVAIFGCFDYALDIGQWPLLN